MKRIACLFYIAVAIALQSGCFSCSEQLLEEASSPNGNYVAALFARGCGATTSVIYHINLRSSGKGFSSDSRGVIEDGQVFVSKMGNVKLNWKDDNTLSIECADCQDNPYDGKCARLWDDVQISCPFKSE